MFVVGLFIVPSAESYFFSSDRLNCAASIVRVFALFSLVVGSGSTLLPSPLFVLVSVSLERF